MSTKDSLSILGWWSGAGSVPVEGTSALVAGLREVFAPVFLLDSEGRTAIANTGTALIGAGSGSAGDWPVVGFAPPCPPENLGSIGFTTDHGLRYPYVAGAMANGIASEELVEAMSRAGMLGFFGSAGLEPARVERAIDRLQGSLGAAPFGCNLIHSPGEPALEAAIVDLYLRRGVRLAEASAYLRLTLPVVRYRVSGIHRGPDGRIVTPNRLVAKVSRIEVARRFLAPPPDDMLAKLVAEGSIDQTQAELARHVPMAQDLTAEADSGGHTDNRPALALIPTMLALRDRLAAEHGYDVELRIGAGGGIATPASVAAAFSMGAAYVVTGTINQSCIESGTSDAVREMLAGAEQADVAMAPAADMFEMGVKVQVLKRGTLFAVRATRLYEAYRNHDSIESLPANERNWLEKNVFQASLDEIWERTEEFFRVRDPRQIERAQQEPKHRMALVFRWYLGLSSHWANAGEPTRRGDYQIWCGPAMGAFNEWVRGSALEGPTTRRVADVARNLLYGAAVLTRARALRAAGRPIPPDAVLAPPLSAEELNRRLEPRPQGVAS